MREHTRWHRSAAGLLALALVASACNGDDDEEAATGPGVTEEPCPDAVNEDNGCIYLGVLSDLTEGPFAPLGVEIVDGQRDFWRRVNEAGGIGGYDINIDEYTRDTRYNPQEHATAYREIEPDVLALAQTLGTPPTEAILPEMDEDDMVGVPASWWSGWHFEDADHGVILPSGYSYCIESMIGLDWVADEFGDPDGVLSIGYPGDYGGDAATGVEHWANETGAEFLGFTQTQPNEIVGDQDGAVQAILDADADFVHLAVGPAETGEIVVKAAARGFEGRFVGSVPTWNPALMADENVAGAMQALYHHVGPWEDFGGDSAAHEAMREMKGDDLPANDGYTFGWIWSYPLLAALEAAADAGDLTREGLRGAIDGLEVDYEGALPTITYGPDPDAQVVRQAVIGVADPDAPLQISSVETEVTSEVADGFDYTEPCAAPN